MYGFLRIPLPGKSLLAALVLASAAIGCVYNVRDMAFVDFGAAPYHLYCYVNNSTAAQVAADFRRTAAAVFPDTNVRFQLINVDRQPRHPSLEHLRFWNIHSLPALILVSPKDRSLVIPMAGSPAPSRQQIWDALEAVATSPVREKLLQHIIGDYAVVLVLEGRDAAANRAALSTVRTAGRKVSNSLALMPKQNGNPPALIPIPQAELPRESVLVWSLGIDTQGSRAPAVAVLYGLGRRLGPVLTGKRIQTTTLFNTLSTVGLSCECGLDRSYLLGTRIPLRWDAHTRSQVTTRLGFDPDDPMVRTEMSMIMSMGVSSRSGSPDQYAEQALPTEGRFTRPRMSPVEFQELASPGTIGGFWTAPLATTLLTVFAGLFLVAAGALFLWWRARKRFS